MTEIRDLPLLAILPVDKLILHEYHDPQRTPPIAKAIESSGTLRNPPIVVPLRDGTSRYMVLDGANRTTAIQSLGLSHIVAQVVTPDDPGLNLTPWYHVIWGIPPESLLEWFSDIPDLVLHTTTCADTATRLQELHAVSAVCCSDNRAYVMLSMQHRLLQRVAVLNAIVDSYKNRARMDRTRLMDLDTLRKLYPDLTGLVLLPTFRIDEVIYVIREGMLMPPGSTRFLISPRALHLNYPIAELAADKSLAAKNADLQNWMQARLSAKRVRYYAEATFLFDE